MAGGRGRRPGGLARDAPRPHDGRAPHRTISPNSSARTPSAPTTPRPTRSACSIARCGRWDRSSSRPPTPIRCRREARSRSTATDFRRPSKRRSSPIRCITLERGEIAGLPPEDWESVIIATGPLTSPALAEAIGAPHRRGRARLLRRHRADRAPRFDRHGRRLDAVALRQGGAGRRRARPISTAR